VRFRDQLGEEISPRREGCELHISPYQEAQECPEDHTIFDCFRVAILAKMGILIFDFEIVVDNMISL
jgi:hypothetical protein